MMKMNGGVTAPKGFMAWGDACGVKKNGNKDIAIVCSENVAHAVGVFTTNTVKGHSLQLTMQHIQKHAAKAVIINSGNANACVGEQGMQDALEVISLTAEKLGCIPEEIIFNSTGVIGVPLNMEALRKGIASCASSLSQNGSNEAAQAIMTTDTFPKQTAMQFEISGKQVTIGGIAKGSGMIHPNMATMIGILTTDANISVPLLDKAFKEVMGCSFNRISVDGDTSVCDMVVMLANGSADNDIIDTENEDYEKFKQALTAVCTPLAKQIAQDGEGATKLLEVVCKNAIDAQTAYKIVTAVAKSPLVKTAMFGEDANWGRIITAAGYAGASFDPTKVDIYIGDLMVCTQGCGITFDEAKAKDILKEKEIQITIDLNAGTYKDQIWTCDFSYDYVKINGSYRS